MDSTQLEQLNTHLEREAEVREQLREQVSELDKKARAIVGFLNKIHSTPSEQVPRLLDEIRPLISSCQGPIAGIVSVVPSHEFWRWRPSWTQSLQTAVFGASMVKFLAEATLISPQEVSTLLGVKDEWKDRFYITTEDYLHGLISTVNELSRLAINSVTLGDFQQPIRISLFVKDLSAGFSVLNLKNDSLRRRFDSLKYDMKKIEEVVYDVSLRKLASPPTTTAPSN